MAEKEYISKDYALYLVNYFGNMLTWSKEDIISEIKRKITEESAADVAPVRHGRWVKEKTDVLIHWHCSACRECYYLDMPNAEYCPHCGAKMDGGEGE